MSQASEARQALTEAPTVDGPADPIAAVTHRDPYPYYRRLATERPLYRDDALGLWVASSAAAATAVLTSDLCRVRPADEPVPRALAGTPAGEVFGRIVRMTDGEGHPPLKQAVSAALAAIDEERALAGGREQARALIADLRLPTATARLDELVLRLPVQVVASLLGVERDRLPPAGRRAIDLAACFAPGAGADRVEHGAKAAAELSELLRPLAQGRPGASSPPLLGILAEEIERAGCAAPQAAVANAIGFLFQACETTAGLIGGTLLALAAHREVRERVRAEPEGLGAVIAEVLRCDPPVQNTRRFVDRDGSVAGREMRRGDAILVVLAAAGRDPAAHADPDRFDPWRADRALLSFGAGDHACPGQALAATIARAAVQELLAAGLDPEPLAASVTYRPSGNLRSPLFHATGGRPCTR